jgi:transposase
MAFREVSVVGVKEILRLWLMGHGTRSIARHAQIDRKTVRRYVEAALAAGLSPGDQPDELTDELVGEVVDATRPGRRAGGHGRAWELMSANREFLQEKLKADLTIVKIHDLFQRRVGETVPYRSLHRFCAQELGHSRDRHTVRVSDCDPGEELQVDFGRMGIIFDPETDRRRVCWALIFTAVFSRHMFVWLTHRQSLDDVISGFETAWEFFDGVFKIVIIDNLKAVVTKADAIEPRLNDTFVEYAQARGFVIDPTRIRSPQDKPRVERMVSYVRESFFKGEHFVDLIDAQRRADPWCRDVAGLRIHGTTHRRPAEVFAQQEHQHLLAAPRDRYDIPIYRDAKVHRDHHIEIGRSLYSVPGDLIGQRVLVRADSTLVRVFFAGKLIKVHPRMGPGARSTDPEDYPEDKRAYALRDLGHLMSTAASHGPNIGEYAERLLASELPWTRMRQVYRLLGLVRRYGAERVDRACQKTLELDVVDVTKVQRVLERALEDTHTPPAPAAQVVALRFARPIDQFRTTDGSRGKR